MRIGIPRALMFYRYYPFLRTFLEGCGHVVESSPPTDLQILEYGTGCCVDDVCVAVKVFLGHVRFLEGRVDALLIPRPVTVERRGYDTFTCPKLIAAPDMIRFFPHRPPLLLEWVLDLKRAPWWWGCLRLAARLRVPPTRARVAYLAARREQAFYESLLGRGYLPQDALRMSERKERGVAPELVRSDVLPGPGNGGAGKDVVTVAVIGHPYLLSDSLVNKNLFRWLREAGASILPCSMLKAKDLEAEMRRLPDLSWSYERELLAASSFFSRLPNVDGLLYLTSFGCGPDSMVVEMVRREVVSAGGKAFLEVVLDEHSAESGVRTRAEAFVDLLRWRKARRRENTGRTPLPERDSIGPPICRRMGDGRERKKSLPGSYALDDGGEEESCVSGGAAR